MFGKNDMGSELSPENLKNMTSYVFFEPSWNYWLFQLDPFWYVIQTCKYQQKNNLKWRSYLQQKMEALQAMRLYVCNVRHELLAITRHYSHTQSFQGVMVARIKKGQIPWDSAQVTHLESQANGSKGIDEKTLTTSYNLKYEVLHELQSHMRPCNSGWDQIMKHFRCFSAIMPSARKKSTARFWKIIANQLGIVDSAGERRPLYGISYLFLPTFVTQIQMPWIQSVICRSRVRRTMVSAKTEVGSFLQ